MKSALVCKPCVPLPEPRHGSAMAGSESHEGGLILQRTTGRHDTEPGRPAARLTRIAEVVAGWLRPGSVQDETPSTPEAQQIEALERHIRQFTEEHRFTGFPC